MLYVCLIPVLLLFVFYIYTHACKRIYMCIHTVTYFFFNNNNYARILILLTLMIIPTSLWNTLTEFL